MNQRPTIQHNILTLLFIIFFFTIPKQGSASIVVDKTENFKGFTASVSIQVGCVTTGDYPTEEVETEALNTINMLFATQTADLKKAYQHYLKGKHPFSQYRQYLDNSDNKKALTMKYFYFLGFVLNLHIKEHFPHIIQKKIRYNFILSQAFKGGVIKANTKYSKAALQFYDHNYNLEKLLRTVIANMDKVQSIADTKFPDRININNRNQLIQLSDALKAKIVLAVLNKKPYGQSFFDLLARLPEVYYFQVLDFAVLMMSDNNKEDKAIILAFAKKYKIKSSGSMPLVNIYNVLLK